MLTTYELVPCLAVFVRDTVRVLNGLTDVPLNLGGTPPTKPDACPQLPIAAVLGKPRVEMFSLKLELGVVVKHIRVHYINTGTDILEVTLYN